LKEIVEREWEIFNDYRAAIVSIDAQEVISGNSISNEGQLAMFQRLGDGREIRSRYVLALPSL
jgi:hypothetical protein